MPGSWKGDDLGKGGGEGGQAFQTVPANHCNVTRRHPYGEPSPQEDTLGTPGVHWKASKPLANEVMESDLHSFKKWRSMSRSKIPV